MELEPVASIDAAVCGTLSPDGLPPAVVLTLVVNPVVEDVHGGADWVRDCLKRLRPRDDGTRKHYPEEKSS